MTEEHKQKIAEAVRAAWAAGKFADTDFKPGRHRRWPIGKRHSDETKKKISQATKGRTSWAKGKTKATDSRIHGGASPDPAVERRRRAKISDWAKKSGSGGYKPASGRSKKSWHDSPIAGRVFLQSSYEVRYAKWLDANGIRWTKNWTAFDYELDGIKRQYVPDFHLLDSDEYIEIKGFATAKDRAKWAAFPHRLTVLFGSDLDALEHSGR